MRKALISARKTSAALVKCSALFCAVFFPATAIPWDGVQAQEAATKAAVPEEPNANEIQQRPDPSQVVATVEQGIRADDEYRALREELGRFFNENLAMAQKFSRNTRLGPRFPPEIEFFRKEIELRTKIADFVRAKGPNWRALYLNEKFMLAVKLRQGGSTANAVTALREIEPVVNELFPEPSLGFAAFQSEFGNALVQNGFVEDGNDRRLKAYNINFASVIACGQVSWRESGQNCSVDALQTSFEMGALAGSIFYRDKQDEARSLVEESISAIRKTRDGCDSENSPRSCDFLDRRIGYFEGEAANFYFGHKGYSKAAEYYQSGLNRDLEDFDPCLDPKARYCRVGGEAYSLDRLMESYDKSDRKSQAFKVGSDTLPLLLKSGPFIDPGNIPNGAQGDKQAIVGLIEDYVRLAVELGETDKAKALLEANGASAEYELFAAKFTREASLAKSGGQAPETYDSDSLPYFMESVRIARAQYGPKSLELMRALDDAARSARSAEEYPKSRKLALEALDIARSFYENPETHPWTFITPGQLNSARNRRLQTAFNFLSIDGEHEEARKLLETHLSIPPLNDVVNSVSKRINELATSPLNAEDQLVGTLARLQYADPNSAKQAYETAVYLGALRIVGETNTGALLNPEKSLAQRIENQFRNENKVSDDYALIADAAWNLIGGRKANGANSQMRKTAFEALQKAVAGLASLAVNKQAADAAILREGGPELLAKREALNADEEALDLGRDPDGRDKLQKLIYRNVLLQEEIFEKVPNFRSLILPQALSLVDSQSLFDSEEAGLMWVPSEHGTHVVAVTSEGLSWHRSDMDTNDISDAVKKLRIALDQEIDRESGSYSVAFDRKLAHTLYEELVAPVADALEGKTHVYVATSGALTSLPLAVLVAEPPQGDDADPEALRNTAWLDTRFALVQIPSLQSLKLLRELDAKADEQGNETRPFEGFGAPALKGKRKLRDVTLDEVSPAAASRGALADVSKLAELEPLRFAATELQNLASSFGYGGREARNFVRLEKAATETAVKQADLSRTRVLAFATHGLLAGEIDGLTEPGLVFTPPEEGQATELDDGYLTASEVTLLDLDADWIILSACNTAGGDKVGAPGLSGLARAFFYAGARGILATHWRVRDDIATQMVPATIAATRDDPGLSRAQAFNSVVQSVRGSQEDESKAHPAAWAPFILIGDR